MASKEIVKEDLCDDVKDMDSGEGELIDHHRAQGIE